MLSCFFQISTANPNSTFTVQCLLQENGRDSETHFHAFGILYIKKELLLPQVVSLSYTQGHKLASTVPLNTGGSIQRITMYFTIFNYCTLLKFTDALAAQTLLKQILVFEQKLLSTPKSKSRLALNFAKLACYIPFCMQNKI